MRAIAVATVLLWRSRARYSLKAAGLATGTLIVAVMIGRCLPMFRRKGPRVVASTRRDLGAVVPS